MIKDQTRSVIFRTYQFAQQNGLSFNLSYIDAKGLPDSGPGFDTEYMRRLYDYGYQKAWSGRFWQTRPPSPSPGVIAHRGVEGIMGRAERTPPLRNEAQVEDEVL